MHTHKNINKDIYGTYMGHTHKTYVGHTHKNINKDTDTHANTRTHTITYERVHCVWGGWGDELVACGGGFPSNALLPK